MRQLFHLCLLSLALSCGGGIGDVQQTVRVSGSLSDNANNRSEASNIVLEVFELYGSTNEDCSSPRIIRRLSNVGGQDFNLSANGLLISSRPPEIVLYNCLIVKVSDTVTVSPDPAEGGSCADGASFTKDLAPAGAGFILGDLEDNAITPTGGEDDIFFFFNTGAALSADFSVANANGIQQKTVAGFFPIATDDINNMTIFYLGSLDGSGGSCDLSPFDLASDVGAF